MLEAAARVLIGHPELALFLALGLGYALGRIRIGSFLVGPVTGSLLAGVLIGQTGVAVSPDTQQAFFLLFLFAIGFRVGPQFFSSFDSDAIPQFAVTVVLCLTGLLATWACAVALGLNPGIAAGLLGGALTESATIGTAHDAIAKLDLPTPTRELFISSMASTFAVSYLIGTIGVILLHSQLSPRLLRRPLVEACRELERELGADSDDGSVSGRREVELRAYRIGDRWIGHSIAEAEAAVPEGSKAIAERIRRGGTIIDATPDMRLERGDIVAISGHRGFLVEVADRIGDEVDDVALLDFPFDGCDVVITEKAAVGRTLRELRARPEARTVYLRWITRAGSRLPVFPDLRVKRGDVLRLEGSRRSVERAAALVGRIDGQTDATDMVFVGLFIFLGGLVGIPAFKLGALDLGLGLSVGVLIGGLVAGWLRSRRRGFGFVPEPVLWLFDSVGLSAFIACVGISAGPRFIAGIIDSGVAVPAAALIILVVPHIIALLFGSRVLKMNEGVLLGTLCGAGTSAAALAAVQAHADSRVPTLGYGIGYAMGNVLLALWGTVIVLMLAGG